MLYCDTIVTDMMTAAKALDNKPYQWGYLDCFNMLNVCYRYSGLPDMQRSVVDSVMGVNPSHHPTSTQMDMILKGVAITTTGYQYGTVAIVTGNYNTYGTALILPEGALVASGDRVHFMKMGSFRRAVKMVKNTIPKSHLGYAAR